MTHAGHGLVMKIGDFGMSRQVVMRHNGDQGCLERALSANVIGTAAYSAPELLLADSPVKKNRVDAGTVLKSDVSLLDGGGGGQCLCNCLKGEGGDALQLLGWGGERGGLNDSAGG